MPKKLTTLVIPAIALLMGIPAAAPAGFVTNGSFESFTNTANPGVASQLGSGTGGYTALTGWTVGANTYGFLMAPGVADSKSSTGGSYSPQYGSYMRLWGTNNGGVGVIPTSSPDGGNYVVLDAADGYRGTGISQVLTGLTVGQKYTVSFNWASGQQYGYNNPSDTPYTNDALQVTFGSQVQTTATEYNVNHGFTDWSKQTFTFTADATSDTLNFLAMSTSGGLPPMVLLDGVNVAAVPEPASLALVGLGLTVAAVANRVRRRKVSVA